MILQLLFVCFVCRFVLASQPTGNGELSLAISMSIRNALYDGSLASIIGTYILDETILGIILDTLDPGPRDDPTYMSWPGKVTPGGSLDHVLSTQKLVHCHNGIPTFTEDDQGIDIDLVQRVAVLLAGHYKTGPIEVETHFIDAYNTPVAQGMGTGSVVAGFDMSQCDVLMTDLSGKLSRRETSFFGYQYIQDQKAVYYNTASVSLSTLNLPSTTIATTAGGSSNSTAHALYPDATIVNVDLDAVFAGFKDGSYDAICLSLMVMGGEISDEAGYPTTRDVVLSDEPDLVFPCYRADDLLTDQGNEDLQNAFILADFYIAPLNAYGTGATPLVSGIKDDLYADYSSVDSTSHAGHDYQGMLSAMITENAPNAWSTVASDTYYTDSCPDSPGFECQILYYPWSTTDRGVSIAQIAANTAPGGRLHRILNTGVIRVAHGDPEGNLTELTKMENDWIRVYVKYLSDTIHVPIEVSFKNMDEYDTVCQGSNTPGCVVENIDTFAASVDVFTVQATQSASRNTVVNFLPIYFGDLSGGLVYNTAVTGWTNGQDVTESQITAVLSPTQKLCLLEGSNYINNFLTEKFGVDNTRTCSDVNACLDLVVAGTECVAMSNDAAYLASFIASTAAYSSVGIGGSCGTSTGDMANWAPIISTDKGWVAGDDRHDDEDEGLQLDMIAMITACVGVLIGAIAIIVGCVRRSSVSVTTNPLKGARVNV
eukprot:gnl/Dysnectes_brevis/1840_a2111_2192.p1 GENE.gnl/Dysnectes_brevis/1840_a2111_2192~~gnl/Dysnectes_brevis/1840_a2111_2192.p1  ORF type:complete len:712 (-),score=208.64 gnl/Dysnectes_brevis/1840_a2111_2192:143-2278(-)